MAPAKIRVLFVDHEFQAIGKSFKVITAAQDEIEDLKEKAIKKSGIDVTVTFVSVWTSTLIIDETVTPERLAELLRNVKDEATEVHETVKVAGLGLTNGQVLLMQVMRRHALALSEIDALGDPITSSLNPAYKDSILYAHTKGKFIDSDFVSNDVVVENDEVPEFVRKYEEMLSRKRKVLDNVRCFRILSCCRLLTDEVR
ncbi:hypothetical protein BJV77DRAFT_222440 [Russula vinacea]|nr:hypothetical protein BJV77DRAFT_222440 [Russula vinacea]